MQLIAFKRDHFPPEVIRFWPMKFGTAAARNIRCARQKATSRWHIDVLFVNIGGQRMWLWRAVYHWAVGRHSACCRLLMQMLPRIAVDA